MSKDRRYSDAKEALVSLESAGFAARLAGGCVRDRLLGHHPKDYDIATKAHPDAVIDHFRRAGYKVVPTGIEHGTVTLIMPAGPVEITTLREDVATDGRRAQVRFGESFEIDAARRDFTINAMYEDKDAKIYDYHDGQKHLGEGKLVFVGDPNQRIQEDYLRILRFFRFAARFGFSTPPATLAAITANKEGLRRVSQERITSEIWQTLATPAPQAALQLMHDTGVLALVLPELGSEPRLPGDKDFHMVSKFRATDRPIAFLALLLAPQPPECRGARQWQKLGTRLRLSVADTKRLVMVAEAASRLQDLSKDEGALDAAAAFTFVNACESAGGEGSFALLYLPLLQTLFAGSTAEPFSDPSHARRRTLARISEIEQKQGFRRTAVLPLNGHDVIQLTGEQGSALGKRLAALDRAFRNGEWQTREQGLAWLRRMSGLS